MQELPHSFLNLPVSVHIKTIEDGLNQFLPEVLYEDKEANDDGLLLIAKKAGRIKLEIKPGIIEYRIPLSIWLKKLTMLSDIEVEAALMIALQSKYEFLEIDLIQTQTELVHHEWITKPEASLGRLNLPVQRLADFIIKRSKTQLVETIDQQVNEQFQIRTLLAGAWARSEQPIPLYPPLSTWLVLQPQKLGLLPLQIMDQYLYTQLQLEAQPKVYAGNLPAGIKLTEHPVVVPLNDMSDQFKIQASGEMTLAILEQAAKQQLIGQAFSFAGYDVQIESIKLRGSENRIQVHLDFSGSYDGWAKVSGTPVYNESTQVLSFAEVAYELDKSNPLISGLGWLFKRTFEKKLKEALTIQLQAPLESLRQLAQNQLQQYSFHPTLKLQGQINNIDLLSAIYKAEAVRLKMEATGTLRIIDQRTSPVG